MEHRIEFENEYTYLSTVPFLAGRPDFSGRC